MTNNNEVFSEEELSEQQRELRLIEEALTVANNEKRARLPENVFRDVFLPFFAGDENPKYKTTLANWLHVAGSYSADVAITDQNGNVLFTVPPLTDQSNINVAATGTPLSHVANTYQQLNDHFPGSGREYLERQLLDRNLVLNDRSPAVKHYLQWDLIFKRYNRPGLFPAEVVSTAAPVAEARPSGDDFDYEMS